LVELQAEWTEAELSQTQEKDNDVFKVIIALRQNKRPTEEETTSWSRTAKQLISDWNRLRLGESGVLRRAWFDATGREIHQQIVLPRDLVTSALQRAHDDRLAGHLAERRTLLRLRKVFHWPGMSADVRHWCRSCDVCNARKAAPSRPHHALIQDPVSEPLQRVAIDILGPLDPCTTDNNRYVVVITDYFTKWVEAVPVPNQTAETVARVFVEEFVCRFGVPRQLHSDQGRQFESSLFKEVCNLLGIRKSRTTALHPQSDGQCERFNRTLLDIVAKMAQNRQSDWDRCLPYALAAYRSSVHSTTQETPNFMMMGRKVETPLTLMVPHTPEQTLSSDWASGMVKRFRDSFERVQEARAGPLRTAKAIFDRRQRGFSFEADDLVWLYEPKVQKVISHKLDAHRWTGPWIVTKKISDCVYLISCQGKKSRIVNVDRLRPYLARRNNKKTVNDGEFEVISANDEEQQDGSHSEADSDGTVEYALRCTALHIMYSSRY
jgi:hypothetical protein